MWKLVLLVHFILLVLAVDIPEDKQFTFQMQPQDSAFTTTKCKCEHDVALRWSVNARGETRTSPALLYKDRRSTPYLVIPTASQFVEMISGVDGSNAENWPVILPHSTFDASPLFFDIDGDGDPEVVLSTREGSIVFFKQNGDPVLNRTLTVPPLRVKADWNAGLNDQPNEVIKTRHDYEWRELKNRKDKMKEEHEIDEGNRQTSPTDKRRHTAEGWMTERRRRDTYELFDLDEATGAIGESAELDAVLYSPQYKEYLEKHPHIDKSSRYWGYYVCVDAHIISTPVLADINGDGVEELVVAVNYYFDQEQYSEPEELEKIPEFLHPDNYVCSGIAVFDLVNGIMLDRWNFDMSTATAEERAFILGSPVVLDVNGDGKLEIVVATSLGYIYVTDVAGHSLPGFPVEVAEVQGTPLVEDVNGDGEYEIVVFDGNAILSAIQMDGNSAWEIELRGISSEGAILADINGDDRLDIVIATDFGYIWAVDGTLGELLPGFPITMDNAVYTRPIVAPLSLTKSGAQQMQVIVPSWDGHLYIIDGYGGCVELIDIGEKFLSGALIGDFTGDGLLDIVVASVGGSVMLLNTRAVADTASCNYKWANPTLTTSPATHSISLSKISYNPLSSWGMLKVRFRILDERPAEGAWYDISLRVACRGSNATSHIGKYDTPGEWDVWIDTPFNFLDHCSVSASMKNEHGQVYKDELVFDFLALGTLIQWIYAFPAFLMLLLSLYITSRMPSRNTIG